ncbi:MAG: metallophosphoesterase [Deltaproteobacteria bacterium]|nr:metallophosphoesterase [Deltaproteobacteria bacterium]
MRAWIVGLLLLLLPMACSEAKDESQDAGVDAICEEQVMHVVDIGPPDETFHVGPYLGHTTTDSVAISWESLGSGDTRLEYGADETLGLQVQGDAGTMHQVVLEGLSAGTRYFYKACTGTTCTGVLSFKTAPRPRTPFRFAVYGDTQDNPDIHAQVAAQTVADQASLVIVVGDLVSDGNFREQYKERFFDPARAQAHSVPRYAAVGNHDRKDTDCVHFIDYMMFPEDPDVPQAEASYSFTYGDAFFLVFDNTLDHYDFFFPLAEGVDPLLWLWLQAQAQSEAAQNSRWRFAFAHYPADSNCYLDDNEYGPPESAMRAYVLPMLWEAGFQGYFSGHQHCYERFDFDGHLVMTVGGGGGALEPQERCDDGLPEARLQDCVHHHALVEIGCEHATIWGRDKDGRVIERLQLNQDGSHQVID